tara:strand:- start:3233 stop:3973 length:741 start_codon:yes stop_codon:yes gene_type:complete
MTKFIAEIGLNHLGDVKRLNKMVKFLVANKVFGISVQILDEKYYDNSKSFRKKIAFSQYLKISKYLKKKGVKFGIATNNIHTLKKYKGIKVDFWKIISTKFFDTEILKYALKVNKTVYLSCGIASLEDIYLKSKKYKKLNFIHTSFSDDFKNVNLSAINTIRKRINKNISFGLHSDLNELVISAISLEVDKIFFYVKFDDKKKYPDHKHAINLEQLKRKLLIWKKIIISIGDGKKKREKLPKWVFE